MMSKRTIASDAENTGFGFRKNVAQHKPGFDQGSPEREPEADGNHRFRRSEEKDVPRRSLADRLGKPAKGE
jgi:hypothetical protein